MGGRHVCVGEDLPDDLFGPALILRCCVGMQVTNCHGLDTIVSQLLGRPPDVVLIEGRDDLAFVGGSFCHLEPAATGYQRFVGRDEYVVHGGSDVFVTSPDLDHVGEVPGGDHPGHGAVFLYEGVGRQCRPVDEKTDLCKESGDLEPVGDSGLLESVHQSDRRVGWRGGRLELSDVASRLVKDEAVGESSSDVDRYPVHETPIRPSVR